MRKTLSLLIIGIFLVNVIVAGASNIKIIKEKENQVFEANIIEDFDPLVDINITFEILAIRALDEIDKCSKPDFFVKLFINDDEFTSPFWDDKSYLYNCWNLTYDVDDYTEQVNITIQLWDRDSTFFKICDISKNKNKLTKGYDVNLIYDIRTGRWSGDDDFVGDSSGYGRVNGASDGSIYNDENDCELWFNIVQNDYDHDTLPYWVETNIYNTDPMISNLGDDKDEDELPIEWEHRFGYNPLIWDDHHNYDPDFDSIDNWEEYMTWNFGSDPHRQDVFLEMDFM